MPEVGPDLVGFPTVPLTKRACWTGTVLSKNLLGTRTRTAPSLGDNRALVLAKRQPCGTSWESWSTGYCITMIALVCVRILN